MFVIGGSRHLSLTSLDIEIHTRTLAVRQTKLTKNISETAACALTTANRITDSVSCCGSVCWLDAGCWVVVVAGGGGWCTAQSDEPKSWPAVANRLPNRPNSGLVDATGFGGAMFGPFGSSIQLCISRCCRDWRWRWRWRGWCGIATACDRWSSAQYEAPAIITASGGQASNTGTGTGGASVCDGRSCSCSVPFTVSQTEEMFQEMVI